MQPSEVNVTELWFSSRHNQILYKELVMIKEFEKKQPVSAVTESGNEQELIRTRAYELYVERGMEDGHELEDWLRAQEELASGSKSNAAA